MRKLLLVMIMLLGVSAFGEKITTGNMTWAKLQAPDMNGEYSGTWMSKEEIEKVKNTVGEKVEEVKEAVKDKAEDAKDAVVEGAEKAQDAVEDAMK